ncbi:MAG: glycerol-3-phosphate 1-O-acyltransferase PlsY [Clostridia bacterium]|nr:glycerol-3-phosphate 1-O-acyltransferase PlsY [Clostridia bacterium]
MKIFAVLLCSVAAYLLGSVNTAIILSSLKGKDIRKEGSGNAGATNTLRVMGKKAAALVALFDGLKGVVAVLVARLICYVLSVDSSEPVYLSALCVMLGHIYPLYFGFKGGKGIMTTIAVVFMLDWRIGLILFVLCIAIMLITKYVSLGSCIGAALFPVLVAIFHAGDAFFVVISVLIGALAIFKHRSNILRLFKGTESKLNFSK